MGIQSFAGVNVSTEGIVTVKLTGTLNTRSLPVPFSPGNYRIDTGFSGSLRVAFLNNAGTILSEFTFATTSFFTISDTATSVVIQCPQNAINGIITVQQLKRGVVSVAGWQPVTITNTGSLWGASLQCWNNRVYIIGGTSQSTWEGTSGSASIQYWDKSNSSLTGATTVVRAANADLAGASISALVGNSLYLSTGKRDSTTFRRFDLTNNTMSNLAGKPWNNTLHGYVANSAGTRIYMFGAYESGGTDQRSAYYDISANTWTTIANVPNGSWNATVHSIDPDDANVLNVFGNEAGKWWRYSISANTYTDTGYSVPGCHANQTSASVNKKMIFKTDNSGTRPNITNFAYYWQNGANTGAQAGQGHIVPNSIYAPLPEDGGGAGNSGCAMAADNDYIYYHALNSNFLWYIPRAQFVSGNGL